MFGAARVVLLMAGCLLLTVLAAAQTTAPILMPNTFSTVAGGATATITPGSACATGSPYVATDLYGNGCPATQAALGFDFGGGVAVDTPGNIFINDGNNFLSGSSVQILRKVDAKSGIITQVMSSGNTLCTAGTTTALGSSSSYGDGCPFSNAKYGKQRGIATDPYGNVLLGGYGTGEVQIVCNAVSPLCPVPAGVTQSYSTALKQVGYVYRIAGCVATANGSSTPSAASSTAPSAGDGYFASSFGNQPGDVTAWGASNSSFASTPTSVGTGGTCGTTTGEVLQARGITADVYGNVYIADTGNSRYRVVVGPPSFTLPNGTVLTNPLPAMIALNATYSSVTAAQMYGRIYPILGGFTAVASGGTCGVSTATDAYGDGCPFYQTKASGTSGPLGVTISATGDLVVVDGSYKLLRVLYTGPTITGTTALSAITAASNAMAYSIYKNNTGLTSINKGYVYVLAGGGSGGYSYTARLGTTAILGNSYRIATGPDGNFYITNGSNSDVADIEFYDLSTGFIREVAASSGGVASTTAVSAGGSSATTLYYCPTPGAGDGTAATNSAGLTNTNCFEANGSGSGTLGIAVDGQNNIYINDAEPTLTSTSGTVATSNSRVRKIAAGQLFATSTTGAGANPVGSTTTGTLRIHAPVGFLTASGTAVTSTTLEASSGLSVAQPVCLSAAGDNSVDCYATATLKPVTPGVATATLALAPNSSTSGIGTTVTSANYAITGVASGSALVADPTAAALTAPITAYSVASNVVTFTAANTFSVGQQVLIYGLTTTEGKTFNRQMMTVTSASPGGFSANFSAATTASTADTGTATGYVATVANVGGSAVSPKGVVVDGAGDVFTMDTSTSEITEISGTTFTQLAATPSNPTQMAIDPSGNLYAAGTGNASIIKLTLGTGGGYSAGTITPVLAVSGGGAGTATVPQAVAVDRQGNLYFADKTSKAVYQISTATPNSTSSAASQPTATIATGLNNPTGLAFDGNGNLYIADQGATSIYRVDGKTGVMTTSVSSVNPVGLTADSGGNVYYQDGTTLKLTEVSVSGASSTVLTSLSVPTGLATAPGGNLYSADTAQGVLQISRNALTYGFGTSTTTTFAATVMNAGNLASTGLTASDATEFPIATGASNGCGSISVSSGTTTNTTTALAPGAGCNLTTQFTPAVGTAATSSANTFLAAATTTGALNLTGTESGGSVPTTMLSITGNPSTNTSNYTSGAEIVYTFTLTASDSSAVSGSVAVSITNASSTVVATGTVSISAGTGSYTVTGVPSSAGSYTLAASFSGTGYQASSGAQLFTITQNSTSVSWTPGAMTQQYSAAVGTSVLNAAGSVPGVLVYSATPSGGSAQNIHSASYLPMGTYSLGVTLVPTDSVNYAQSTATVSGYTVTKAATTAGLGATQVLVASDGTGNYTSVQSAVNALGASGGAVYLKPGTYTGDVTVVQPNVSLRGLGGDPTKVVISHAGGAFGGTGVYAYAGEFNSTQNNSAQLPAGSGNSSGVVFTGDEGSATLVVARGINTAISSSQLVPNGFYAENVTVQNTYNTDTSTTTTTYLPTANGGTCTANEGAAMTYSALYNASLECASQALAIWTTSDLTVMNNVYAGSLQDTVYTASPGQSGGVYSPTRQYWFRGKISGDVDYIFGDAAAVFDSTTIYSAFHGTTAGGTITIEAQNKAVQTGSANDYLSGYIMNNNVFTSQAPNMTSLYFGRPYGTYSTWIMLNSYVDQVTPSGYTTGLGPVLTNATYGEYNDIQFTDPATNGTDLNGVTYVGTGGNSGSGVTGTRETVSTDPGTPLASNGAGNYVSMTQAEAQAYFPTNFLSQAVPSSVSSTVNWNPTAALASNGNAFTGSGSGLTVAGGSSVTLLMRPQTPGLGAIVATSYSASSPTATVWTIPTGSYSLSDTFNSATTTLASGTLDASGEAYYNSSSLAAGTHTLTWTYGGDANFSGSSSSGYTLVVTGSSTATTLSGSGVTYGQAASVKATVSSSTGTPTGSVTLTVDGTSMQTATLSGGTVTFPVTGLTAGMHSFSASYGGGGGFTASTTSSNLSLTVTQATVTVTGVCTSHVFDASNTACSANVGSLQYSDTVAAVFAGTPGATATTLADSASGTYPATPVNLTLTSFGSTNYVVNAVNGSYAITGNTPQMILFAPLPSLPSGTYALAARTTSGLPVSYSVTGTGASVSGSSLTLSGASGATITVTASTATDPTGDYAAATPVAVSFTAQ
jgi:hypothetical protein